MPENEVKIKDPDTHINYTKSKNEYKKESIITNTLFRWFVVLLFLFIILIIVNIIWPLKQVF